MLKKLLLFVAVIFFMAACGGGDASSDSESTDNSESTDSTETSEAEDTEETAEAAECEAENAVTFKTEAYKYKMDEVVTFDGDFEVKQAWFVDLSQEGEDSKQMNIYLANYEGPQDRSAPTEDGQMKIECYIIASGGNNLQAGQYPYAGESGYESGCSIKTNKGEIYFNWAMGEPSPGDVTIDGLNADAVCGTLNFNIDLPEDETKGVVSLNGTFKAMKAE